MSYREFDTTELTYLPRLSSEQAEAIADMSSLVGQTRRYIGTWAEEGHETYAAERARKAARCLDRLMEITRQLRSQIGDELVEHDIDADARLADVFDAIGGEA